MIQRSYLAPSYASDTGNRAFALDVLADILGGGTSARLSKALVIDQRIVNDAGAFYSGDERDSGKFVVYAAASPGSDLGKIEAALDEVIAAIIRDGVTAAELERAKRRLRADAIYALDSQSRLARTFGTALTNGGIHPRCSRMAERHRGGDSRGSAGRRRGRSSSPSVR